ncbi:MAG: tetratricopeptide repeat protein [Cyclobacteriaceae bacterium]
MDFFFQKAIILLALIISMAAALGIISFHFFGNSSLPISTGLEPEKLNVPIDTIEVGTENIILETQNYLVFQWFESLPPETFPYFSQIAGLVIWTVLLLFLVLMTTFSRYSFLIAAGLLIFLLSFSGVNSLNIGGISTNYGMMICLIGLLLPASLIHIFFEHWSLSKRTVLIFLSGIVCLFVLIYFSNTAYPTLLFSENIGLMAMIIAGGFLIYIGHAFISNVFVGLVNLNLGVGIRISWHFGIISILYLGLIALMYLDLTGDVNVIPLPPYQLLFIIIGVLGFLEIRHKIQHLDQPYQSPWVGKAFYLLGFALTGLVILKAKLVVNTPMFDFLEHIFIYSQLGFGLLFFLYLLINFSGILNSGRALDKIIYQPPFFPYFHMRLGGFLSFLILLVYADAIVAVQFNTASTMNAADYYLATNRPLEARVLYENAFERYRNNKKALNAAAHLYLQENQPTAAIKVLTRSFEENPNVPDILLLAENLKRGKRLNESIYYLETGLKYFPDNSFLTNNLALHYLKINLIEEAKSLLTNMEDFPHIKNGNLMALNTQNDLPLGRERESEGLLSRINLLAYYNLHQEKAGFELATDTIRNGADILSRAIIRNQWTNNIGYLPFHQHLVLLDSLIVGNGNLSFSAEEDLRESGLVLRYKAGEINELLKQLNGMAYKFNGNAGYYHAFAGSVLSGQMDLEKAAVEWKQALEKGFSNFKAPHLPVLYFGGKPHDALFIWGTHKVPFPDWMVFGADKKLVENDTVTFFRQMADLPKMLGTELIPALEKIQGQRLQALFIEQLILKKSHWLQKSEIDNLMTLYRKQGNEKHDLEDYVALLEDENLFEDNMVSTVEEYAYFSPKPGRNAYLTPMVLKGLEGYDSDIDKYNHLLEASQFNKDPLLWINLVKYSRKIGLDQYASKNLAIMSEWVGSEDLIALQLEHL